MDKLKRTRLLKIALIGASMLPALVMAEGGSSDDLANIASSVTTQISSFEALLKVAAYVIGTGFGISGILQLKAHKENPQQAPLGKAIGILVAAAALMFFPSLMSTAGSAIFGSDAASGSISSGTSGP